MTREEKLKKAVAIAVAYYVEQEKASVMAERKNKVNAGWHQASRAIQMNMNRIVQQRSSIAKPRTMFKQEEPYVLN